MKITILAFSILLSTHSFANATNRNDTTRISISVSSDNSSEKEVAQKIINDSQNYMQSGNLSVLLRQKIDEVQKDNQNLSFEDALDLIVTSAETQI